MNILSAERASALDRFNLILAALDVDAYEFVSPRGLSAVAIYVPQRRAVIALTTAAAPFFRAGVQLTAAAHAADVVLLRSGDVDGMPTVSADIALAAPPCAAWVEYDLALWQDDGSIWLVPHAFGPSIEVGTEGFAVRLTPPYETLDERAAGIARAAQAFAGTRSLVGAH